MKHYRNLMQYNSEAENRVKLKECTLYSESSSFVEHDDLKRAHFFMTEAYSDKDQMERTLKATLANIGEVDAVGVITYGLPVTRIEAT